MAYPLLSAISDSTVKQVVKLIYDRLDDLESRLAALEESAVQFDGDVDCAGSRLTNLAIGTSLSDAVTLAQLKDAIYQIKKATT